MHLDSKGKYLGNAGDGAEGGKVLIYFGLVVELWEFGVDLFQFGGESLISVGSILCQIDLSEGPGS